jgi:hypothetical protein
VLQALTPFQEQLAGLQQQYPAAIAQPLPSGAILITISGVDLPPGWSKSYTAVQFVVPLGFPHAQPDCFWADQDLKLQSGTIPQNTAVNPIPETGVTALWFSWHLTQPWNPNKDTLSTWVAVIRNRLRDVR